MKQRRELTEDEEQTFRDWWLSAAGRPAIARKFDLHENSLDGIAQRLGLSSVRDRTHFHWSADLKKPVTVPDLSRLYRRIDETCARIDQRFR
jgi:hypothetical protein